jgi:hypothetical protein
LIETRYCRPALEVLVSPPDPQPGPIRMVGAGFVTARLTGNQWMRILVASNESITRSLAMSGMGTAWTALVATGLHDARPVEAVGELAGRFVVDAVHAANAESTASATAIDRRVLRGGTDGVKMGPSDHTQWCAGMVGSGTATLRARAFVRR